MYSLKAKIMVAEQIVGMIENNVINECGMESFIGWLEDGDVFYAAECYEDSEIEEAMHLAREISELVDELSWKLAVERED